MASASAQSLRVLVTNWLDRANPTSGGAETHFHEIFGRLASRGHKITAVTSGWPGGQARDVLDGIEIHRVGRRYTFTFHAPRYVRGLLASNPQDVLIEDLNKLPLLTPLWSPRPVGVIVHHLFGKTAFSAGPLPVAATAWLGEQLIPAMYRSVPIVAVSESTVAELESQGIPSSHLTLIHNGVDSTFLSPDPAARARTPTFLYVGRLQRYKRVDLILRAMVRLRETAVNARLIIAGRGPDEPRLRELARSLNLGEDIFAGFVSEERKRALYRQAWVNVAMSDKEGWGITVLEAGACGTPTIASDVPGLRDSVVRDKTGFLVPPRDPVALADALQTFCHRPELVDSLGAEARRLALQYTWERAAERMEQFLSKTASVSAGRSAV